MGARDEAEMAGNNPFARSNNDPDLDDTRDAVDQDDTDDEDAADSANNTDSGSDELARTREALRKANLQATKFRKQLDAVADKDKTEQQRISERAEAAEKRAEKAERQLLRLRVASRKHLPADLADRLQGDTEEELEDDADALLKLLGVPQGTSRRDPDQGRRDTRRDPDQGRRDTSNPADSTDMNNWMRSRVRQR